MSQIIAITNQKGGVGKTTTAANLAAGMIRRGFRVLSIDMDAQGNLSYSSGLQLPGPSVFGVLSGEIKARDAIRRSANGDFIASSPALAGMGAILTDTGKEYRLKESLEDVAGEYDYILLDTPPALGIVTINALTACNSVIIPAQADIFSLAGIEQLANTIDPVKRYCNPNLVIMGILLTRFNPRSTLSKALTEVIENTAIKLETKVFKSRIREAVAVREAQLAQQSLFDYAPTAKVTQDYAELVSEIIGG